MIVVMLYHCVIFWGGDWFTIQHIAIQARPLGILGKWLNSYHVYGFTLVSGYLFYYLKAEAGRYIEFLPFVINKSKRLLIPYVFTCIIWVAPIMTHYYKLGLKDVIYRFILGSSPGQLWFLLMLFWIFIVGWLLSKKIFGSLMFSIIISVTIYVAGIVGNILLPNIWMIWTACNYFPCFVLGMCLRKYTVHFSSIILITIQVLLFVISQVLTGRDGAWIFIGYALDFLLHIVSALMAWSVLQWLGSRVKWKESKVFMALSKNSMPMYLFHQQIIYFTIYWLNGKVNPYLHAGINFVVALGVSFIISSILMKWKVTRFLIGEKA